MQAGSMQLPGNVLQRRAFIAVIQVVLETDDQFIIQASHRDTLIARRHQHLTYGVRTGAGTDRGIRVGIGR